jgi:hypothetical protein
VLNWYIILGETAERAGRHLSLTYFKRYRFISMRQPSIKYNKTYLAVFVMGDKTFICCILVRLAQIPGLKAYPR